MKKITLLILTLSISLYTLAQENPKQKEVGLVMSSFNSFGLTYRFGNIKSLWRLNTLLIYGNEFNEEADSLETTTNNSGLGFAIGKEFRNSITDNLEIRYGFDVSFDYSTYKRTRDDKTTGNIDYETKNRTYSPGVNLVFGLNYIINEQFVIGAELLPGVSYSTGTRESYNWVTEENDITNISQINYGISNTSARLTFLYRF
jgi:hypothetical protein